MEYPKYEAEIYSKGEEKIYKLTRIDMTGNTESRVDELVKKEDKEADKERMIKTHEAEIADLDKQLTAISKA